MIFSMRLSWHYLPDSMGISVTADWQQDVSVQGCVSRASQMLNYHVQLASS